MHPDLIPLAHFGESRDFLLGQDSGDFCTRNYERRAVVLPRVGQVSLI
jgi:hypothetical protein